MYDFCLTLPYGALLALGGFVGLLKAGSISSALAGCGFGCALMAIGWSSYQEFADNKNEADKKYRSPTYAYVVVSLVVTLLVTMIMGERYLGVEPEERNLMPAGYVFYLSIGMVVFYLYKLFFSGDVGSTAERAYKRND